MDEYGNVLREASVGYGRRPSTAGVVQTEPGMEPEDRAKQQLIHVTVTNRRLTKALVNEDESLQDSAPGRGDHLRAPYRDAGENGRSRPRFPCHD